MGKRMKRFFASAFATLMAFTMTGSGTLASNLQEQIPATQSAPEIISAEYERVLTEQDKGAGAFFWRENFEKGLPEHWSVNSGQQNRQYMWTVGNADGRVCSNAVSGTQVAQVTTLYDETGAMSTLATYYMDVSALLVREDFDIALDFWYVNRTWFDDCDSLSVYMKTMDGMREELFHTDEEHRDWTNVRVVLPHDLLLKSFKIEFEATNHDGHGIALDDAYLYEIDREPVTHSITYDANGGSGTMTDANAYPQGLSAVVQENEFTAPEGFFFSHWCVNPDGRGMTYQPGDTFHVWEDTTLYAQWSTREIIYASDERHRPPELWLDIPDDGHAWAMPPTLDLTKYNCAFVFLTYPDTGNLSDVGGYANYIIGNGEWQRFEYWVAEPVNGLCALLFALPKELMQEDVQLRFAMFDINDSSWSYSIIGSSEELHFVNVAEGIEHGSVNVYPNFAMTGDPVRVRISPDNGYVIKNFSIMSNGEQVTTYFKDGERYFNMPNGDVSITAEFFVPSEDPEVGMAYVKCAFDGKLGLVYFVDLPEELIEDEDAYVTMTQCGVTKTMSLAKIVEAGENEDGYYRIPTYMPAAYYRENVKMRIYDGEDELVTIKGISSGSDLTDDGVNYTLERYVNYLKGNNDEKIRNLAIAMEDYCTAAQIYFDHPTEGVNLTLSDAVFNVTQEELEGYKAVRQGTLPESIEKVTLNASFESDNALKLGITFKNSEKPSNVRYFLSYDGTLANAVETPLRGNATDGYYLAVRNVAAAYLGKNYTFYIMNTEDYREDNVYSITLSLFTYARAVAFSNQPSFTNAARNLTKAMYLYGKAAQTYFGVTN